MTAPTPDRLEEARHHATLVGCASAKARGLDDWDALALDAAKEAERLYLARHANDGTYCRTCSHAKGNHRQKAGGTWCLLSGCRCEHFTAHDDPPKEPTP